MLREKILKKVIFIVMCLTFLTVKPVYAVSCDGIFTADAYEFINEIIDWIRILVPILLIVLCSVDLGQAVLAGDDKQIKTATSRVVKRAIAAVAIFFVPLIVRVLINAAGIKGKIVDDPTCGLEKVGG